MESSAMPSAQHGPLTTFKATPVFSVQREIRVNVAPDILGEGPVWDDRSERLFWIDIIGRCVSCYDVASNSVSRIGLRHDMVGFAVPTTQENTLMCGSQLGLFTLAFDNGRITRLSHPERGIPQNRFNDGKTDPTGRLFAGTMQMKLTPKDVRQKGTGRLYTVGGGQHTNPTLVEQVGKVTVSNGMGWSPEGDKMYYIDTQTQQVQCWEYSTKDGSIEHRRVVYEMPSAEGSPDGMAVDAEGLIWVCALRAGEVRRIDPADGAVVAIVKVPTPLVTSCCFGGPYLSTLFITTARHTSDVDAGLANPDKMAGLLYSVDVGVSGLPMTPFRMAGSKL